MPFRVEGLGFNFIVVLFRAQALGFEVLPVYLQGSCLLPFVHFTIGLRNFAYTRRNHGIHPFSHKAVSNVERSFDSVAWTSPQT